jgi:arsenite methyltransferase
VTVFDASAAQQLEHAYLTADVTRQRAATTRALDLQRGERALDIGCGPGLLAEDMTATVGPSGRVVAIDSAATMARLASRRSAGTFGVALGDATRLPFASDSLDAAAVVQVLEYVADVDRALAEIHRVLRPGGRALVLDTDWASLVWHSPDPHQMSRIISAWLDRFSDPHLPRTLARRARKAGFRIDDRQVLTLFTPEYEPDTYCVRNADIIASFVTGRQGITVGEARDWLASLSGDPDFFFSLNRYLFRISKPA